MGGVPTLLLAIAVGITYGWQPDQEGGVEYIIQVPPDQIEQLEKTGEISSVIAPEVRGHVSRVIIRVGQGPLPQELPAALRGRPSVSQSETPSPVDVADATPVPIPEMLDERLAQPIAGPSPAAPRGEQAVLKPDTNTGSSGSAYGFPGLPPTLQTGTGTIDQAGREISSPAGTQVNSILGPGAANTNPAANATGAVKVPPPGTRSPSSTSATSPPPFTGNDPQGDYARARVGGPSTDPTNSRDNSWSDFPPPSSINTATAAGPSTNSVNSAGGSGENPFRSATSGAGNPAAGSTNGLAPGDTYGRMPSGLSFSSGGDRGAMSSGNASSGNATYGAAPGSYGNSNPSSATSYGASGANGFAAGATNQANASGPDPRLTPVQVAAGAWSIDAYGRIYDRQGRMMNGTGLTASAGNSNPGSAPTAMNATANSGSVGFAGGGQTIFGGQNASGASNQSFQSATVPNDRSWGQSQSGTSLPSDGTGFYPGSPRLSYGESTTSGSGFPSTPPLSATTTGSANSYRDRDSVRPTSSGGSAETQAGDAAIVGKQAEDPPSLSDRRYPNESSRPEIRREVVAPQPLFNGLLLISLVANVYLIFWLKNLRIQFRELVAAKRMAGSNTP